MMLERWWWLESPEPRNVQKNTTNGLLKPVVVVDDGGEEVVGPDPRETSERTKGNIQKKTTTGS